MRFGSVCSGIEAASVAWEPLGWTPVFFSEIDKFPSAVLAHRWPEVPNLGDMTKFKEWPDANIDVLVGGTPCQSFSVAGLRKGLDDPRGNLMLTFGAVTAKYRPEWVVWENVPGVLSSNNGRDFGTFLGMLGQLGYGFAYRVLDAQYFGVAQRRRRVFVVGCLGNWRAAAAVLFERHSLSGHSAPSREARKEAAADAGLGAKGSHWDSIINPHPSLSQSHNTGGIGFSNQEVFSQRGGGIVPADGFIMVAFGEYQDDGSASAMKARDYKDATDLVVQPTFAIHGTQDPIVGSDIAHAMGRNNGQENAILQPIYGIPGNWIGRAPGNGGNAVQPMDNLSPNLTSTDRHAVAFAQNSRDEVRLMGGDGSLVGALAAEPGMKQTCYVAQTVSLRGREGGATAELGGELATALRASSGGGDKPHVLTACLDVAGTMKSCKDSGGWSNSADHAAAGYMHPVGTQVRRLTPTECERLQGFPDGYTKIPDWYSCSCGHHYSADLGKYGCPNCCGESKARLKTAADGPRYKALGNSMAVPVMRWIGRRIDEVDKIIKSEIITASQEQEQTIWSTQND